MKRALLAVAMLADPRAAHACDDEVAIDDAVFDEIEPSADDIAIRVDADHPPVYDDDDDAYDTDDDVDLDLMTMRSCSSEEPLATPDD